MMSTLLEIIHNGSPSALTLALESIESKESLRSEYLLQKAALLGKLDMIKVLARFLPLNATDLNGCTALWYAAEKGNADIVAFLAGANANVNISDRNGNPPLFVTGSPEVIDVLDEMGADFMRTNNSCESVLEYIARNHRDNLKQKIESIMLKKEAQMSPVKAEGEIENRFTTIKQTPKDFADTIDYDGKFIRGIIIDGERFKLSKRFYQSLAARMHIPFKTFGLFTPIEILQRAAEMQQDMPVNLTLDRQENVALGIVEEHKKPLPINQIYRILKADDRLKSLDYEDGRLIAMLDLRDKWNIAKDSDYRAQINCTVPVDGLCSPAIYLAFYRLACSNGAVAEHSMFKTRLEVADQSGLHFSKLLQSFNNRNGLEFIHQRLQEANNTKASVRELLKLDHLLINVIADRHNQTLARERLLEVAGNPCVQYGVCNLDAIGEKKRPLIPVECSVADLLNFSSELGTHYRTFLRNRGALHTYHGVMLSKSFDLEDMYHSSQSPRSLYLKAINFNSTGSRHEKH